MQHSRASGYVSPNSQHLEKEFDKKEFMHTYLMQGAADHENYGKRYGDVIDSCNWKLRRWEGARRELEQDWEECWAHYLSNYRGNQLIERNTVIAVGNVENQYRHRVTTSKGYEIVETANAYLQGAFFPSKMWFYLLPKYPLQTEEWEDELRILNRYVLQKLEEADVRSVWDRFCRQALVIGTSCIAMPWLYDTRTSYKKKKDKKSGKYEQTPFEQITWNNLNLDVVDMFDVYLDPAKADPRDSDMFRRMIMTKGSVLRMIDEGFYPLGDKAEIMSTPGYSRSGTQSEERIENLKWVSGLGTGDWRQEEEIAVYEYWGDLIIGDCEYLDTHVVFTDSTLLVFEPNPFWGGKPFIFGTLVDGHQSPYGMGILEPVKGLLHQLYLSQNHRLDCDDFIVDPMFLVKSDGSVNPEDIYTEPGRVILVEDPETDIKQIELSAQNVSVQIQDEGLLEQRINQATGVGEYINTQGRDAERVTAEEVRARQNAGGNRLGRFHKHLEDTALRRFLRLSYAYLQQFVRGDEVVRLERPNKRGISDDYEYYSVGEQELAVEMDLIPIGADHIIDKETELRERIDFYTFIQNVPQAAQFVNWKEVVKDLARRLIKDEWDKFVILPEDQGGLPVDPGTGQSQAELLAQMQQGQQAPPQGQMPPEAMPPMPPEGGGQQPPNFEQAQLEAMMSDPAMAEQAVQTNAIASEQLIGA
jgi:hypothetical protein